MYCYKCGKMVNEDSAYCGKCGAKLATELYEEVKDEVSVPQKKTYTKVDVMILSIVAVIAVMIVIKCVSVVSSGKGQGFSVEPIGMLDDKLLVRDVQSGKLYKCGKHGGEASLVFDRYCYYAYIENGEIYCRVVETGRESNDEQIGLCHIDTYGKETYYDHANINSKPAYWSGGLYWVEEEGISILDSSGNIWHLKDELIGWEDDEPVSVYPYNLYVYNGLGDSFILGYCDEGIFALTNAYFEVLDELDGWFSGAEFETIQFGQENMYYVDDENGCLYRRSYDRDGRLCKLTSEAVDEYVVADNIIYYVSAKDGLLHEVDEYGVDDKIIVSSYCSNLVVGDGMIYFTNHGKSSCLFSYHLENGETKEVICIVD